MMPASIMELPLTCKINVASLLLIKYSSRLMVSRSSSSAGEGNPASTIPRTLVFPNILLGTILPCLSFSMSPASDKSIDQLKDRILGPETCELHDLLVAGHALCLLIEINDFLEMFFHDLSIVNDSSLVKKNFPGCRNSHLAIYYPYHVWTVLQLLTS